MNAWFRHVAHIRGSLQWRVSLTVTLAFLVVAAVLFVWQFVPLRQDLVNAQALVSAGEKLSERLSQHRDRDDVHLIAREWLHIINDSRRELTPTLGVQLGDVRLGLGGEWGWESIGPAWEDPRAAVAPGRFVRMELEGRAHHVWRSKTAAFGELLLAEPVFTESMLMQVLAREMLPSLLLAFPIILLPTWLAVRFGLKPLSRLAHRLAKADLSRPDMLETERGELQPVVKAFNSLMRRLKRVREREHTMLHDTAHELRTPLAAVLVRAHELVDAVDGTARPEALRDFQDAVSRVAHVSEQLLQLAKLEAEVPEPPVTCDLAQVVRLELAALLSGSRAVHHEVVLQAPQQVMVRVQRATFCAALVNLVDNALKYTSPGSCIQVVLEARPGGWMLSVADDGPGLPLELHARIFDRFVRGHHPDTEGTGLGLAIVEQAARNLGGRVPFGPGLGGQGVTFTLDAGNGQVVSDD